MWAAQLKQNIHTLVLDECPDIVARLTTVIHADLLVSLLRLKNVVLTGEAVSLACDAKFVAEEKQDWSLVDCVGSFTPLHLNLFGAAANASTTAEMLGLLQDALPGALLGSVTDKQLTLWYRGTADEPHAPVRIAWYPDCKTALQVVQAQPLTHLQVGVLNGCVIATPAALRAFTTQSTTLTDSFANLDACLRQSVFLAWRAGYATTGERLLPQDVLPRMDVRDYILRAERIRTWYRMFDQAGLKNDVLFDEACVAVGNDWRGLLVLCSDDWKA